MKTTATTALSTNVTFANAQQFASWISNRLGRSQVIKLNKRSGSERLDMLMHEIVMYSKGDEIAFEYDNAAYGLQWAINTGRCNAETVLAIRAMNCRQLSMLVHELMTKCENSGEYARYLMQKQQKGKLAKPVAKKAAKTKKQAAVCVASVVEPIESKESDNATVALDNGIVVYRYNIATTSFIKYMVYEPYKGHSGLTYTKEFGKLGDVTTRPISQDIKDLRSGSVERCNAVDEHYASLKVLQEQYIRQAFREDFV